MVDRCWRCGGRNPQYALRTPEYFAGRICAPCEESFKAWVAAGISEDTPDTPSFDPTPPHSPGPEKAPNRKGRPPGSKNKVKKPKPQPADYKKPVAGERPHRRYKDHRESLEDKVEKMRYKLQQGDSRTVADRIEDEMYGTG